MKKIVIKKITGGLAICMAVSLFTGCSAFDRMTGKDKETTEQASGDPTSTEEAASEEGTTEAGSSGKFDPTSSEVKEKTKEIEKYIDNYFYFPEDPEKQEESYYDGIMEGLGDKYSVYYTPEEYKKIALSNQGQFYGIGVTITKRDGKVVVTGVPEDGPSAKAGIEKDDILVKADGVEITEEMDLEEVVAITRGEEGTTVNVEFYRPSTDETTSYDIVRGPVDLTSVYSEIYNNIGYIYVKQFVDNTDEQFIKIVDEMVEKNVDGIIIDLRYNPGGMLTSVSAMCDYILEDDLSLGNGEENGLIVYTEDKYGKRIDEIKCSDGHSVDIPIAVLVNQDTASAAELMTCCLQDYKKATIVGTTTYGKGIVQSLIKLSDGSAIKITIAKYFSASGYDIHEVGVIPDVEVKNPEKLESVADDEQFQRAMELLGAERVEPDTSEEDEE